MKEIKIRGNKFFYKDLNSKNKETILLVHGHPFDHTMWKYQYEIFENYRLILPDLKGYGKSDFKFDKIYIEEQALDLAFLLDELEIKKVHLIGLSMGGQIIMEFSRLFPHRVKSLVIAASSPSAETQVSYNNRLQEAERISKIGMLQYTKESIHEYMNLKENNEDTDVYKHLFKMMSETQSEGAVASHYGRAERRNNLPFLKHIDIPTLFIAAEIDTQFTVEQMKNIANQIPNSLFKLIRKSGHLPNMEQPDVFNNYLLEFYKTIK
tara:strand:- start:38 stop:835 length:798 start_codon:yes stop_codon:yes gene_type:complete